MNMEEEKKAFKCAPTSVSTLLSMLFWHLSNGLGLIECHARPWGPRSNGWACGIAGPLW